MRQFLSFAFVFAFAGAALAHGPTPQKVEETIEIAAPAAKVWEIAKDFAGISAWNPEVAKSEGSGGNAVDATRTITLKSGGDLQDSIDEYNDKDMTYGYRLAKENVDAFPVSFYSSSFTVKPNGDDASTVEWIGRFYRADTGNFPPEDKNDAAAIAAMTKFFQAGLNGLKAKAEGK